MFTIRVGRRSFTAEPIEELKVVEFALGVLNDKAYVGYWQDVAIKDEDGDEVDVDKLPVLVFEDEIIPYTSEQLRELGVKRATIPVETDNWWSGKVLDVDPAKYYNEVYEKFRYYIDTTENNLHFLALWTIGTMFHNIFAAYPYLHLHGVRRSGKTKTLTLIKLLGFNSVRSHSMSAATIYRLIESSHVTLLLDEQDYLADPERRAEFRILLLGGYKKGSFVYRSEKTNRGKIQPMRFSIYSPKALANIEGLEDVLQDRTITLTMLRSVDEQITRREPFEDDPIWLEMRNKLASLYIKYWKEVRDTYLTTLRALGDVEDYTVLPDKLKEPFKTAREYIYSRPREIWAPIITLAVYFETKGVEGLVEKTLSLAKDSISERQVDEVETPEAGLVLALKKLYYTNTYYPLKDIHDEYKKETGLERLDPRTTGRLLKRLGFKNKRQVAGRVQYYITEKMIKDLARRLGVELEEKATVLTERQQTQLTLQTLLIKAQTYCQAKGSFTVYDITKVLGVSEEDAKRVLKLFEEEKKVVRLGDTYTWVNPSAPT